MQMVPDPQYRPIGTRGLKSRKFVWKQKRNSFNMMSQPHNTDV